MQKQIKNFIQGMTPFINEDGISRIEHFDLTTNQARPFRELVASSIPDGSNAWNQVSKFLITSGSLFCLADADKNNPPNNYLTILVWNVADQHWDLHEASAKSGTYAKVFTYYNNYFYGLREGTNLWQITSGGVNNTFQALTYTNTTDFLVHSKDGIMYIPTDNKLNTLNVASYTADVLTLLTDFRITSLSEHNDFILIAGFNTKGNGSIVYLWDRDSSLATLTGKYNLGLESVWHSANLSGISWTISSYGDSTNSSFAEKHKLIIRYLTGDNFKVHKEYQFDSLAIGGKYVYNNKLYFNASFIPLNETGITGRHWVVFCLDDKGDLSIAQNVGINDAAGALNSHPGIIRDGDAFWIGGYTDGTWNTDDTYGTTSIVETTKHSSPDLTKNIDTVGAVITFEPLPSGASVVLKTKKDEETAWTTVATFADDNACKGSIPCADLGTAKNRQFRVESAGGAVINSFQVNYEEKNDEQYG